MAFSHEAGGAAGCTLHLGLPQPCYNHPTSRVRCPNCGLPFCQQCLRYIVMNQAQVGDAALDLLATLLGAQHGLGREEIDRLRQTSLSNAALSSGRGYRFASEREANVGRQVSQHSSELIEILGAAVDPELYRSLLQALKERPHRS